MMLVEDFACGCRVAASVAWRHWRRRPRAPGRAGAVPDSCLLVPARGAGAARPGPDVRRRMPRPPKGRARLVLRPPKGRACSSLPSPLCSGAAAPAPAAPLPVLGSGAGPASRGCFASKGLVPLSLVRHAGLSRAMLPLLGHVPSALLPRPCAPLASTLLVGAASLPRCPCGWPLARAAAAPCSRRA